MEIAKHPAIALDLLVFQVASTMLDIPSADDGADVQFKLPRLNPASEKEPMAAGDTLAAIAKSLSANWFKPRTEAARFEAFRSLPDTAKLDLLAYCWS